MKKIILLTSGYPFREKGEEFIESEMRFLETDDYNVQVCAVTPCLPEKVNKYVPKMVISVALFTNSFSGIGKAKCCFRALLRPHVRNELRELLATRRIYEIRSLISFCSRGERIFSALCRNREISENTIIYSYWLLDTAYAGALLKQKYGCTAISRVHGGDLYEERHNGYLPMRKYLVKTLNAIYPVSNKGTNYLKAKYGNASNIQTAYLGTINPYSFTKYEEHEYFHIVSCSYLVSLKRVPMIAEALCMIKSKKIVWTHFGDGQDKELVYKFTNEFSDNIEFDFRGNTPHDEIMDYYRDNIVDLFVNVSKTEGLPVSIMEAISYGIPVIATDVGGTSEVVHNGENGLLIPKDTDAKKLCMAIESFMNMERNTYSRYRDNAYRIWDSNFNSYKNYQKYYTKLCDL